MKELIQIQKELKAPKNQYNSFGKYKYRSCEDILEALKPLLEKHSCTLVMTDTVKEVASVPLIESSIVITNTDGNSISVSACAGIQLNKKGMETAPHSSRPRIWSQARFSARSNRSRDRESVAL